MTDIIYTKVDEAPELASSSFLPIIRAFTAPAGITVGTKDISLAGRILAQFSDYLPPGSAPAPTTSPSLANSSPQPEANVIKLPNISASIPAAHGRHRRAAVPGLRHPRLPRRPTN